MDQLTEEELRGQFTALRTELPSRTEPIELRAGARHATADVLVELFERQAACCEPNPQILTTFEVPGPPERICFGAHGLPPRSLAR